MYEVDKPPTKTASDSRGRKEERRTMILSKVLICPCRAPSPLLLVPHMLDICERG